MTPNKPRIQILVDALRSGEFEQCKGTLAKQYSDGSRKYCCLGVATVLAQRDGMPVFDVLETSLQCGCADCAEAIRFGDENCSHDFSITNLITVVQEYYGFDCGDPVLRDADGVHHYAATKMNDGLRYGFGRIADAFERTFLQE